jgi:hypothetical protein
MLDADALYFSYFHERPCDNVFIFNQTWRVTIEHTIRMVVILAVQYYTNIEWLREEWEEYYRKVKFELFHFTRRS